MAQGWDALDLAAIDLFDDDLDLLVQKHHDLTVASIDQFEKQQIADLQKNSANAESEDFHQELRYVEWQCEEMKQAAGNLALVSLVTRFTHRIIRLEGEMQSLLPQKQKKHKLKKKTSDLMMKLVALNAIQGQGAIDLTVFEDLETARNSIIHHDSRTSWTQRRNSRVTVALRFRGANDRVHFDTDDLTEAIQQCKKQVSGYSQKLRELKAAKKRQ